MKEISKSSTIINAFTEPLPVGESWFEERLMQCRSCPHNSTNVKDKSILKDLLHLGKPYCTLCGCFDDRKCSRKEEECSLSSIGQEPKWKQLAIYTVGEDFDIEILEGKGSLGIITEGENTFYAYNYGNVNQNTSMVVELLVKSKIPILVSGISLGCPKCTSASINSKDDKSQVLRVEINLNQVMRGSVSKTVTIKYFNHGDPKTEQRASIKFKANYR